MSHDEPERVEQTVLDLQTVGQQLMQAQQQVLQQAAQAANIAARHHIFSDYRTGVKPNTRKRQYGDLARFRGYLNDVFKAAQIDMTLVDMLGQPLDLGDDTSLPLWGEMTNGLIKGFRQWMFETGYSFETIRDSLSTIRIYCGLAAQAEILSVDEMTRIRDIKGYRQSQARELEKLREKHRIGHKKVEETLLTEEERERLFQVPNRSTPQGWRDLLMLLLLYDLGIRPSELVTAILADLDVKRGLLRVYRHKTDEKEQWLELSRDAWQTANHYLELRRDTRPDAPLLVTTRRSGQFVELVVKQQTDESQVELTPGISGRKLSERVHTLGVRIGVNINGYDPRHQWASDMVDMDNNYVQILDAGGWTKDSGMLLRYRGRKHIPNKGLKLKRKDLLSQQE